MAKWELVPPAALRTPEVLAVWEELAERYGALLGRVEQTLLVLYVQAIADHRRAREVVETVAAGSDDGVSGVMLRGPDGSIELSPWARRESELAARISKLADQLGLTPKYRGGLPAPRRR